MKSLKTIRLKSGLSQYELAALLGVSRSQLSLAEKSDRKLNIQALLSVAEIDKVIREREIEIDSKYILNHSQGFIESLNTRLQKCIHRRLLLELRLNKMEADFKKAQAVYVLYSYFKENNPDDFQPTVELKLNKASFKILASGKFQQEQLREQIRQLSAEEGGLSECIAEFSKIQPNMKT